MKHIATSATPPHYLNIDLRPYAGRYIAIVEGVVLATGHTAEAAQARAKLARPQRAPIVLYIADEEETARITKAARPDGGLARGGYR